MDRRSVLLGAAVSVGAAVLSPVKAEITGPTAAGIKAARHGRTTLYVPPKMMELYSRGEAVIEVVWPHSLPDGAAVELTSTGDCGPGPR